MTERITRLTLSRLVSETIQIGDDVRVSVVRIDGPQVRLLIEAPITTRIMRTELLDREKCNEMGE